MTMSKKLPPPSNATGATFLGTAGAREQSGGMGGEDGIEGTQEEADATDVEEITLEDFWG